MFILTRAGKRNFYLSTWDHTLTRRPQLTTPLKMQQQQQQLVPAAHKDLNYYHNLKQGSQEWLEARKEFSLTASEFGAALGLSKYKSAQRLLHMKRNNITETFSPFAQKYILGWGQNNEVNAVESFEDHMGLRTQSCGLYPVESSEGQYLFAASPDRLVLDRETSSRIEAVLECKCPYTKKVYASLLLKDCSMPNDHYIQVQAQLAATRLSFGYYVCWTPYHVVICLVKFDRELWTTHLRPHLEEFAKMARTQPQHPPPLLNSTRFSSNTQPEKEIGMDGGDTTRAQRDGKSAQPPPSTPPRPLSTLVLRSQMKNVTLAKQVMTKPLSSLSPPPSPRTTTTGIKRRSLPPTPEEECSTFHVSQLRVPPKKRQKFERHPPPPTSTATFTEKRVPGVPLSPYLQKLERQLSRPSLLPLPVSLVSTSH